MKVPAAAVGLMLLAQSTRVAAQPLALQPTRSDNGRSRSFIPLGNGASPVLVEVRVGTFVSRAMVVRERGDGDILLPLTKILTLSEIAFLRRGDRLESTGRNVSPSFMLDFKRGQVRRGRDRFAFATDELVVDAEGVWVTRSLLKRIVDADVVYDAASADVEIRNAEQLPVGKRTLKEATIRTQRAALQQRNRATTARVLNENIAPGNARRSIVVDYQLAHQRESATGARSGGSTQDFSVDIGTALPVAMGVLNVHSTASSASARQSASWSWSGVNNRFVNQVQLGELQTRALESTTLNGVLISNSDLTPPFDAGTSAYGVTAPVGWWVDAFRGSTLVSESRTDIAERRLDVPLTYGTNVLEIVARGPLGEQRSYERSFHTPNMFVRPGKVEYSLAGGACAARLLCNAALSADARYSLGNRATVRAGVERVVARNRAADVTPVRVVRSSSIAYGAMSSVVSRSLVADASLQLGVSGSRSSKADVQIKYEPTPHTMARVDYSKARFELSSAPDSAAASGSRGERLQMREQSRVGSYLRHSLAAADRRISFESWGSIQSWNALSLMQMRAGLSAQTNSIHFRPYLRAETRKGGVDVSDGARDLRGRVASGTDRFMGVDFMLVPPRHGAVGAWWMRSNVESHRGQLGNWSVALARSLGKWRLDATLSGGPVSGQRSFTLSLLSELPKVQVSSVMSSSASRASAMTQTRGAVVYDQSTQQWSLSSEPTTGRSGIAGVVFVDENGDGIREKHEPLIADALLYVNNRTVRTNRDGYFVVWGVPVQTAHQVVLDTASLHDPTWVPAQPEISVRARPGALASADVAIVRAGIVSGTVLIENAAGDHSCDERAQACRSVTLLSRPVRLVLRNVNGGAVRQFDSFSDGTFHEEGVVPGLYEIEVAPESVSRIGLHGTPVAITVRAINPTGTHAVPDSVRVFLRRGEQPSRIP